MSQADVDLKGNTNFVVLKDLNDEIVVPRTNLAAVDLTVANGVKVAGSTLYADLATADDVAAGTLGTLVDASVLNTVLQGKIDTNYATVKASMEGTPVMPASNDSIKSTLSVAKAVDVTSAPSASAGTLSYTDLRGTITWTAQTGTAVNIGFYNSGSAFPKFADNLVYILVADVKNTGSAAVTLSFGGTDILNAAGSLPAGESKRIGIVFSTATSGYFSCSSTATGLEITNLREFEVTGCTDDARKYIAELPNLDDFTKFYLVDYDEQNPWTYIIDMHDSPAVTLMAGLAYKLNATAGTHTLTTDVCPVGYYGEDAHLKLFVGADGNVVFQSPLNLIDALTPNAGHNITIKYRDGQANAYVDDTDIGYVITVNSGTTNGSLYYALSTDNSNYVVFANSTDGTPVDLEGVTANVADKIVVGNGASSTYITGSGSFTKKTVFTNLSMQDAVVVGGTMTMGGASVASEASVTAGTNGTLLLADAYVPEGGTVSVSGGNLAIEKVTGNGGVIDLGGNPGASANNGNVYISDVTIENGSTPGSQGAGGLVVSSANAQIVDTTITDNMITATTIYFANAGGLVVDNATCTLSNTVISGNKTGVVGAYAHPASDVLIKTSGMLELRGGCTLGYCNAGVGTSINFVGSNSIAMLNNGGGRAILSSGAILDLTGNANATPIAPGGGVTFEPGGATVYPSAGSASAYVLGGMTIPRIGNTNVVNLSGTTASMIIANNQTAFASGCVFTGGSRYNGTFICNENSVLSGAVVQGCTATYAGCANVSSTGALIKGVTATNCYALYGGGIFINRGYTADIVSCSITNCTRGNGVQPFSSTITRLSSCIISGNVGCDVYIHPTAVVSALDGCTIGIIGNSAAETAGGDLVLLGENTISSVVNLNRVTISAGATLNLTGNTNPTPINPGGGIIIHGANISDSPTSIIGSAGFNTQQRNFAGCDIYGTSISKAGIIYGATVSIEDSLTLRAYYTPDDGITISSATITGPISDYVITGGLVGID